VIASIIDDASVRRLEIIGNDPGVVTGVERIVWIEDG